MPVFVTDFGLARLSATGSRLTRTGQALGTPAYMSPEQARGEVAALAPATDVWSLGCVLHELLAGHAAFEGDTPAAVIGQVVAGTAPSLRRARPDLPRACDLVVRRALAPLVRHRYPSAAELRDELDRLLAGQPVHAARGGRRRAVALAFAGLVVAGLAVVGVRWVAQARAVAAAEAIATRAEALRRADPAGAATLFDDAHRRLPDRHAWTVEAGWLRLAAGDGPGARSRFASVPAGSAAWVDARLGLAFEAFGRIDADAASVAFGVLADRPGREGRLARAGLALLDDRWADARAALAGLEGWQAALLRGYLEGQDPDGDPGTAEREYAAALADGPPQAWVHNNRSAALLNLADAGGAAREALAALALDPAYGDAFGNLARAHAIAGDKPGAREAYDRFLALRPAVASGWRERAACRSDLGDFDGALGDLTEAIRLDPSMGIAWCDRAIIRLRTGDPAAACADCDAALAADPTLAMALEVRAEARQGLGDLSGAVTDYTAALACGVRETGKVRANRAGMYLGLHQLEEAEVDLAAALREAPEEPNVHANLGFLRGTQRRWREAADAFRQFLRLVPAGDPRAAEFRAHLAQCEAALAAETGG